MSELWFDSSKAKIINIGSREEFSTFVTLKHTYGMLRKFNCHSTSRKIDECYSKCNGILSYLDKPNCKGTICFGKFSYIQIAVDIVVKDHFFTSIDALNC